MSTENFTFVVTPTDASVPLKLSVWINDRCCLEPTEINQEFTFSDGFEDGEDQQYNVRIEMSGKTDEHTKINEQGNIVKDALLEFKNFELMGIDITTVMHKAKYRHNHNGHSDEVVQDFAMSMGCNGAVEFTFTTPIYMWLLEHL